MAKAGDWEIKHWEGGHPVWCQLYYQGNEVINGIHHKDLQDLYYTIGRAIIECREELPKTHKHEMD